MTLYSRKSPRTRRRCLTQRAADKWDSARFYAVFNASARSRFQALPASRPLAANASRWAKICKVIIVNLNGLMVSG
jgi:hypothetical protein